MKGHMKRKLQGILAVLLSTAMVVTCVPATAFTVVAAEAGQESAVENGGNDSQPANEDAAGENIALEIPEGAPGEGGAIETPAAEDSHEEKSAGEDAGETAADTGEIGTEQAGTEEGTAEETADGEEIAEPQETADGAETAAPEEASDGETVLEVSYEEELMEGRLDGIQKVDTGLPTAVLFAFNDADKGSYLQAFQSEEYNFNPWDEETKTVDDGSGKKVLYVNGSYHEAVDKASGQELDIPIYFGIQAGKDVDDHDKATLTTGTGAGWIQDIKDITFLKAAAYVENDGTVVYNYYKATLHVKGKLCDQELEGNVPVQTVTLSVDSEELETFSLEEYALRLRQQKADGSMGGILAQDDGSNPDNRLYVPAGNVFKFYLYEKGEAVKSGSYDILVDQDHEFEAKLNYRDGYEIAIDPSKFSIRSDATGSYVQLDLRDLKDFPFPRTENFFLWMSFFIEQKETGQNWNFGHKLRHDEEQISPVLFCMGREFSEEEYANNKGNVVNDLQGEYYGRRADYDNTLYFNPLDYWADEHGMITASVYVRIPKEKKGSGVSAQISDGSWITDVSTAEYIADKDGVRIGGDDSNPITADFSYYRLPITFDMNAGSTYAQITVINDGGSQTYTVKEMIPQASVKKSGEGWGDWEDCAGMINLSVGDSIRFRMAGSGTDHDGPINSSAFFWKDGNPDIYLGSYWDGSTWKDVDNDSMFDDPSFGGNTEAENYLIQTLESAYGRNGNYFAFSYGSGFWYPEFTVKDEGVVNQIDMVLYNRYGVNAAFSTIRVSTIPELSLIQGDADGNPIGPVLSQFAGDGDDFRNTLKIPADGILRFYLSDSEGSIADISGNAYKNLQFVSSANGHTEGKVKGTVHLWPYGWEPDPEDPNYGDIKDGLGLHYTWETKNNKSWLEINLSDSENNHLDNWFRLSDGCDLWLNLSLYDVKKTLGIDDLCWNFNYGLSNQIILCQEGNDGAELMSEDIPFGFTRTSTMLPPGKDGLWKLNFYERESGPVEERSFVPAIGVKPMDDSNSANKPEVVLYYDTYEGGGAGRHEKTLEASRISVEGGTETEPAYLQINLSGIQDGVDEFDWLAHYYELKVTFKKGTLWGDGERKSWTKGRTFRFKYYPVTVLGWNWNFQQYLDDELAIDLTSDQHIKINPFSRAYADEDYCYKKDGSIDVYVRVLKGQVPVIGVATENAWIGTDESKGQVPNWIKTLGTPQKVTLHERSDCDTYDFYRVRLTGAGKNTLTRAGITVKVGEAEYDFTLEAARMLYKAGDADPIPILSNDQNQPTEVTLEAGKSAQVQLVTGGGLKETGVIARLDDDMSENDAAFKLAYDIPDEALTYWEEHYAEAPNYFGHYYGNFYETASGGTPISGTDLLKNYKDRAPKFVDGKPVEENDRQQYIYTDANGEEKSIWLDGDPGYADEGRMDFAFTYEVGGVTKTYWPSVLATGNSVGDKLFCYYAVQDSESSDYGCQLRFNQANYTLRYEKDLEHDLNVSTVPIDVSGDVMKFYIYKNGAPLKIDPETVSFCEWRENEFEIWYPTDGYSWKPGKDLKIAGDATGLYYALETAGLKAKTAKVAGYDFANFSYNINIYSNMKLNDDENTWIMVNAGVTTFPEGKAAMVYKQLGGGAVEAAAVRDGGNAVITGASSRIDVGMWNVNANTLDTTKEIVVTSSNEEVAKCTKTMLPYEDKWNNIAYAAAEFTGGKTGSTVISYTYTPIGGEPKTVSFTLLVKPAAGTFHIVTFKSNGGSLVASQLVPAGEKVTKPANPTKAGAVFGGWFKDAECRTAWKFDTEIPTADMTLYAKWQAESVSPSVEDVKDDYYDYKPEEQKAFADISATIDNKIKDKTYDGKPYLPTVKVKATVDGKTVTLSEGVDYGVLYKNNINAGTGEVIVVGNGIYTGEIKKEFTIKPKAMSKLKAVSGSMMVGASGRPSIAVYDGNMLLTEGIDYEFTPPSDLTAKKATKKVDVTAKEGSNYTGTLKVSVPILAPKANDKLLTPEDVEITLEYTSAVYSGKAYKPKVTSVKLKSDGSTLENKKYSVKYTNNTNAGTAYVTVKGKSGYCGSVVTTFEITVPPTEIKLTKAIKAFTFNGKLQKPKPSVAADISDGRGGTKSKTLKVGKDYILLYRKNLHANSSVADADKAVVTVKGIGNYEGLSAEFPFTIKTQEIKKASVKGPKDVLKLIYAKNTLKLGTDYTVEFGTESGNKVEAKITGLGDFAGSTVTKKVKK